MILIGANSWYILSSLSHHSGQEGSHGKSKWSCQSLSSKKGQQFAFIGTDICSQYRFTFLSQCTVIITTHRLTEHSSHPQNNTQNCRWMKSSFYKRYVVIGSSLWNLMVWQFNSSPQNIQWSDKCSVVTHIGKQHLPI